MLLYLVRHGETAWNRAGRLQGQSDIPLTAEGEALAAETGRGMAGIPFFAAYASPLARAFRTAELILENRDVPLAADPRLREVCFGIAEGMTGFRESGPAVSFFSDPEAYVPPEGAESYGQILSRARSFAEDVLFPLSEENPEGSLLVVAHGAINRGLLCVLLHTPLADYWAPPRRGNCACDLLRLFRGRAELFPPVRYYSGREPTGSLL